MGHVYSSDGARDERGGDEHVLSYFKTAGENASMVKRVWHRRRGRPQHQGCAAHDGEAGSRVAGPIQEALWLPIKFLLDKIDDVSCIRLEKYDTFRTHAFVRI